MLNDHIKRTTREIDAFLENYTLGTLIVDGNTASLETKKTAKSNSIKHMSLKFLRVENITRSHMNKREIPCLATAGRCMQG